MSTNPFDDIEQEGSYIPIHILINDFLPIIRSLPRNKIQHTLQIFYLAISKHSDLTLHWIDIICNDFKKSSFPGEYRLTLGMNPNLQLHWITKYSNHIGCINNHPNTTLHWIKELPYHNWDWGLNYSKKYNSNTISTNPNVTLEWLKEYSYKNWLWGTERGSENIIHSLSNHPNLTYEWIKHFPTKPWDWERICNLKYISKI